MPERHLETARPVQRLSDEDVGESESSVDHEVASVEVAAGSVAEAALATSEGTVYLATHETDSTEVVVWEVTP